MTSHDVNGFGTGRAKFLGLWSELGGGESVNDPDERGVMWMFGGHQVSFQTTSLAWVPMFHPSFSTGKRTEKIPTENAEFF